MGERRVVDVRGAVGSVDSETAVAKLRVVRREGRTAGEAGAKRQRNLVALEAIINKKGEGSVSMWVLVYSRFSERDKISILGASRLVSTYRMFDDLAFSLRHGFDTGLVCALFFQDSEYASHVCLSCSLFWLGDMLH